MHPVFQKLLDVKWDLFGKWGTFGLVAINLIYTLIWTILGILLPRHGENYYTPMSSNWWRMLLELFGLLLTVYFIYSVSSIIFDFENFFLVYLFLPEETQPCETSMFTSAVHSLFLERSESFKI